MPLTETMREKLTERFDNYHEGQLTIVWVCSWISTHFKPFEFVRLCIPLTRNGVRKLRRLAVQVVVNRVRVLNGPLSKFGRCCRQMWLNTIFPHGQIGTPVSDSKKKHLSPKQPCIFSAVNVCLFVLSDVNWRRAMAGVWWLVTVVEKQKIPPLLIW